MFGKRLQQQARRLADGFIRPLAALGVTPNMVTFIGLLLNVAVAVMLALGYLQWGGVAVLFAGMFDLLDGALARVKQNASAFGAFFDSTLDRYSEGIVLLGILVWAMRQQTRWWEWIVIATYTALLGSLMVSYARARAEGLNLECKIGLFARPERVVILALALLFNQVLLGMAALAVFTNLTALQRIVYIWYITRQENLASQPKGEDLLLSDGAKPAHEAPGAKGNGQERSPVFRPHDQEIKS